MFGLPVGSDATPLWIIVLLGLGSFAALIVAVWRKWKNGAVADDTTIIERLNNDNKNLRKINAETQKENDDLRRKLWYVADCAAIWRRQLQINQIIPKGVPDGPTGASDLIFDVDARPGTSDDVSKAGGQPILE